MEYILRIVLKFLDDSSVLEESFMKSCLDLVNKDVT